MRRWDTLGSRTTGIIGIGVVLGAAQIGAFTTALRRYETGLGSKHGAQTWAPPGGTVLVLALFVLGLLSLIAFVVWQYRRPALRESTTELLGASSTRP